MDSLELEYERPEFIDLVNAVINLRGINEQVFYRRPFRWRNEIIQQAEKELEG